MSLVAHQSAPDFSTTNVYGQTIHLKKLQGRKVYLAFERNAGCPVCNLRMHTLLQNAELFGKNNIEVLLVYESSPEKLREYLGEDTYPFHFIADPDNVLYKQYFIEQSLSKLMKGIFNGLLAKAAAGKKLFRKATKQDGHATTIPSEFLIDEEGKLATVHYGRFLGDHLPLERIIR